MKRRWARALALSLATLGRARADDWTSLGMDGPRSRLSVEHSGAMFGPARWEHTLPPVRDAVYHALLASPAAGDGVLVYGTSDGFVRGLRADRPRRPPTRAIPPTTTPASPSPTAAASTWAPSGNTAFAS